VAPAATARVAAVQGVRRRSPLALVWDHRVLYAFVLPFVALVGVFGLWPIVKSIGVAFSDSATALSPDARWVGLANFAEVLRDDAFYGSLARTLAYTAAAVWANLAFALAYALLLHYACRRGNLVWKAIVFLPVVTPDVAGYITWKWIYNRDFGALNALLASLGLPAFGGLASPDTAFVALLVAELWHHAGFYTVIFLTNLALLDPATDEAARIDGADRWQRLRYVVIPQLRPAITINAVYATIQFLKTFTVVLVMTKGGPNFATNFVSYYAYTKFEEAQYGVATAMATILFVIVLACTLFLYWRGERKDAWR
jgi:multiple sugar transport system permease protein